MQNFLRVALWLALNGLLVCQARADDSELVYKGAVSYVVRQSGELVVTDGRDVFALRKGNSMPFS